MSRIFTSFAVAASLTLTLNAQSLDGQVERNPDDTVTYTIDIDGPPRGVSAVLIGIHRFTQPFQLPGFFNPLWIDPNPLMISPGGVTHADDGSAPAFPWTIDPAAVFGLNLYFQTVSLDLANNFAFGQNFMAACVEIAPAQESYAASALLNDDSHFQIWGNPGQTYNVKIRDHHGQIVHDRNVTVGPNGKTNLENFDTSNLQLGWSYEIWKDEGGGSWTQRWTGSF